MALEEGLNRSMMNSERKTGTEMNNERNARDESKKKNSNAGSTNGASEPEMSTDEQIGFHKGSINTLIAERNELLKMVSITEQLVNAHAAELSKLGVSMMPPSDKN